jgi:HlyD family secretion protein
MRILIGLLLVAAIGGGAFYYTKYLRAEQTPNFRLATAERGDLLITISATGTLEPEEVVDVGAQVTGRIVEFGPDLRGKTDPKYKGKHVDYNSVVKEGQLLARIDKLLYQATLDQAESGLRRAEADLLQMQAKLAQTKAESDRAERLRNVKLTSVLGVVQQNGQLPAPTSIKGISDADYILAKANYEVAQANVKVGEAAIGQQRALVKSAEQNVKYTEIYSPVDGMVIDRRMNIGQTVVSSLSAASIFLVATDLRQMEIWTAVNEADIGRLKVGMPVRFKVDAFPEDTFRGEVSEIRLNAEMQQQVVIYRVIVAAPNEDLKLLPYLSAHVDFEVDSREDVLLVPNAALRYVPRPEVVLPAPEQPAGPKTDEKQTANTNGPEVDEVLTAEGAKKLSTQPAAQARRVWVRKGNQVYPIDVLVGATDGMKSEILGGDLQAGTEIVLGEDMAEVVTEGTNPLAPPRFRGGKRKAG